MDGPDHLLPQPRFADAARLDSAQEQHVRLHRRCGGTHAAACAPALRPTCGRAPASAPRYLGMHFARGWVAAIEQLIVNTSEYVALTCLGSAR